VTIADATGHGIGPALMIAECRALFRATSSLSADLREVTARVNNLLCEDLPDDRFVTAFFGIVDPEKGALSYLSAGHGPLIHYTYADDQIVELPANGVPLGIMPDIDWPQPESFEMRSGDMFIVVTDGENVLPMATSQDHKARDEGDVGPNTGERILSGAIRRGDGEVIHAVLWYCDLRGFTQLAETQPLGDVIALLNAYFDCVAAPVVERGGEILKFIGDAMLAIFPCEDREAALCDAAERATEAALAATAAVVGLHRSCAAEGKSGLSCGVALHVGDVMYGNIGADARLDFTVIGPAVNLVSRIEPLCGSLNVPLVVSAQLAKALARPLRSLGRHALKGIAEPQEIFTPT